MSNYMNYIDLNAIKLGDVASDIGDYQCAKESYSKALVRLRKYQGDHMQPLLMASSLADKIDRLKSKAGLGNSVLRFEGWQLSKTSFVKGSQCLKYLYLDKHKKTEKTAFSKDKLELFKRGHTFEETVRETQFPGGINIKEKLGNFGYFNSYTKHLLNSQDEIVLYEATLIEHQVLVMCDVLVKHVNGLIDIYEIKLNSELNEAILNDLTIQYVVCEKRFGENLNSFNVIMRSDKDGEQWVIKDLKSDLINQSKVTINKIDLFLKTLHSEEPKVTMGKQCNKPYKCEFIQYCKKGDG